MEWRPDHCGCRLRLGDDGEPIEHLERCGAHQDAKPAQVAAECRAKEAARHALAAHLGCDVSEISHTFNADRSVTAFSERNRRTASSKPLGREAHIAAMGNLATLIDP